LPLAGLGKRSEVTLVRRWAAVVATLPLLLAGCSDDPQPKFEPPPSNSPSESESSSPQPQAWEVKSEKGAVAFAKHWMGVLSGAMNGSGETSALRDISAPDCELCEDFAQRLDRIRSSGGFYRSDGWRVLQAVPVDDMPSGQGAVALRMLQSAESLRESNDSKIIRNPASRATWSTRMEWRRGEWLLTDLELEQ
jgi:hypothetical protein